MPDSNTSFFKQHQFLLLLLLALLLRQLPFIAIPFNWLEAFFHELSHGLAALITGGQIKQIRLFANGAGLCTTQGGWAWLISFSGYAGASIWGWAIVLIAKSSQRIAHALAILISVILIISILLWMRDLLTWIIGILLLLFFLALGYFSRSQMAQVSLQLVGIVLMVNALESPLALIDNKPFGDGAALAKITYIPEIIWVLIWLLIALSMLFLSYRKR